MIVTSLYSVNCSSPNVRGIIFIQPGFLVRKTLNSYRIIYSSIQRSSLVFLFSQIRKFISLCAVMPPSFK